MQPSDIENDPSPMLRRTMGQCGGATLWSRLDRFAAQIRVTAHAQAVPALATLLMQGLVL